MTDTQLKALETAWHTADEALRAAEADHRAAEAADRQAQEAVQAAHHQFDLAKQAYHAAQGQCIPGIANADALEKEIAALVTEKLGDGDAVFVVGAGDVIKVSDILMK